MKTNIGPSVNLSAIIVRACSICSHPREMGKPCGECGNAHPPEIVDLGMIASHDKSRWERFKWNMWGYQAAQRRIKKANEEMLRSCGQ
jgi:hypothetical protein